MRYTWDEAKHRRNVAKHGLHFEDAEQVFSGPCVRFEDDRFDYGEERLITLGLLWRDGWSSSPTRPATTERGSSPWERETDVSKKSIRSDLARIDRMRDRDIDSSDIPPLDKTFLKKATMPWPSAKKQLTIRSRNSARHRSASPRCWKPTTRRVARGTRTPAPSQNRT